MRIIFFVGVPNNYTNSTEYTAFHRKLNAEIDRYGDILVVDVVDTYMNITQKILSLYDFVLTAPECSSQSAPQLHYLLKVDDDVIVNPTGFVKRLEELDVIRTNITQTFFYGYVFTEGINLIIKI